MAHRSIIRSDVFERSMLLIEPCTARADEFMEGVEYALLRNPEVGVRLTERVWKLDLNPDANISVALTLYYAFNDETIVYLDINSNPAEEG